MHQEIPYTNGHASNGSPIEIARGDLAQITIDITATPLECIDETVRLCAMRAKEMVDAGVVEQGDAVAPSIRDASMLAFSTNKAPTLSSGCWLRRSTRQVVKHHTTPEAGRGCLRPLREGSPAN